MIHGVSKLRLVALALSVTAALGSGENLQLIGGGNRAYAAATAATTARIVPPVPPAENAPNTDGDNGKDKDLTHPWVAPAAQGLSALGRQTVHVAGLLNQAALGPMVLPRRLISSAVGMAMRLVAGRPC